MKRFPNFFLKKYFSMKQLTKDRFKDINLSKIDDKNLAVICEERVILVHLSD